jgi:Na+/melibiose symporter and related transporters
MSSSITNKKLKLINKIGFATFQFTVAINGLEAAWRMYFYTTYCGISIVLATTLLTISKVITTIMTPMVGYISDNLYKTKFGRRFGRRKGLLLIGMPIKILTAPLYWIPNMPVAYYCSIMIGMAFVGPLMSVSQGTFAAEMSSNSSERAQLAGLNQVSGALVGIVGSLFLVKIFDILGQNNANTFFVAALIYDAVAAIACIIFYKSVFERPVDESTIIVTKERPSFIKGTKKIFNNFKSAIQLKAYRQYLSMYLSEQMFRTLDGKIHTYFVVFVLLLDPKAIAMSKSVGFAFGIAFLTFFIWLTAKKTGTFTYRIGGYASIIILLGFAALAIFKPEHGVVYLIVLTVAMNFGKTGLVNSAQFLITMIPDVDEVVTGKRREGSFSGVNAFLDEIFTTLEGLLIGIALQASGFISNSTTQPQTTIDTLVFMFVGIPIVLIIIGIVSSYRFKLNVENHKILEGEVERLKNGGSKEDVEPEVKALVEELTGFKYEQCWGNNDLLKHEENNITRQAL